MKKDKPTHKDLEKFREFALLLPEAVEEFPFGHSVLKVNKKAFAFLGTNEGGNATIALKLPHSGAQARKLSCAQPTGYGLGKSGWVTVALASRDTPSAKTLRSWIEESYRAIAPKRQALKHFLRKEIARNDKNSRSGFDIVAHGLQ